MVGSVAHRLTPAVVAWDWWCPCSGVSGVGTLGGAAQSGDMFGFQLLQTQLEEVRIVMAVRVS